MNRVFLFVCLGCAGCSGSGSMPWQEAQETVVKFSAFTYAIRADQSAVDWSVPVVNTSDCPVTVTVSPSFQIADQTSGQSVWESADALSITLSPGARQTMAGSMPIPEGLRGGTLFLVNRNFADAFGFAKVSQVR